MVKVIAEILICYSLDDLGLIPTTGKATRRIYRVIEKDGRDLKPL